MTRQEALESAPHQTGLASSDRVQDTSLTHRKVGGGMAATAVIEEHRLAALVPDMAPDEYAALVADVQARGLLVPIVLFEGQVLDGRHRYRACLETETVPRFTEYDGTDALGFVASANLQRRHLTASQRAVLALAFEAEYAARAKERQGTRTDLGRNLPEIVPESRELAAAAVGVSGRLVSDAKKLAQSPDLLAQVKAGELSVKLGLARQKAQTARQREREARHIELRQGSQLSRPADPEDLVRAETLLVNNDEIRLKHQLQAAARDIRNAVVTVNGDRFRRRGNRDALLPPAAEILTEVNRLLELLSGQGTS